MGNVLATKYSGVTRYKLLYVGLVFASVPHTPVKSQRAVNDQSSQPEGLYSFSRGFQPRVRDWETYLILIPYLAEPLAPK